MTSQPLPPEPTPRRGGGPRSPEGKARSRANAVKHGMRCKVVEPPDDRDAIADRVAAWDRSFSPRSEAESWLIAHAAAQSVRVDRCLERERIALEENTAAAERDWMRRRRAWARRTGGKLESEPTKAYPRLASSAFGCDWLIARLDELAADLEIPGGHWSRAEFLRALLLFGIDAHRIPPGHPVVAGLYRDVLAADRAPDPDAVDFFLNLDTKALEPADRAHKQRLALGDRDAARRSLLASVRAEQTRLRDLRASLWAERDAPALEAACARARTFDASPEAALARRYEASQSLELHRTLNTFFRSRRANPEPEPAPEPSARRFDPVLDDPNFTFPEPNELETTPTADTTDCCNESSDSCSDFSGASPHRPPAVAPASTARPPAVPHRPSTAPEPPATPFPATCPPRPTPPEGV